MADLWAAIRAQVTGSSNFGENIAEWTLSRHVRDGAGARPALLWRPSDGPTQSYSYAELDTAASRFARGLRRAGLGRGDTVTIMVGRIPELFVAVLGTLRAGAVVSVLFASYGPDPIRRRLRLGETRLLVTTPDLYREKIEPGRAELPCLDHVLLVGRRGDLSPDGASTGAPTGDAVGDFHVWLAREDPHVADAPVLADTPALLHFTSGTTGEPKGVSHVHEALLGHVYTAREVLGLETGTRLWCTADPGWVTGVSYGILAPLAIGCTVFVDEDEFDAGRWYENLTREHVEVWYTAPTTLRFLRHRGEGFAAHSPRPNLRGIFSVGEPLAAAEAMWVERAFGVPVRDTWWQTETGCIIVATRFDEAARPGRIGHALPAFEVATLERSDDGSVTRAPVGRPGELAVRTPWPSMFRGYVGRPSLYDASFSDGWYLSGDLAVTDEHGWIRFLGRTDDVFKSGGHFVGPAEVEETLIEHEAVTDAAVVGRDDPVLGTQVEAHVILASPLKPTDELRMEILRYAEERLGPTLAPRAITFSAALPRTPSGKIARNRL